MTLFITPAYAQDQAPAAPEAGAHAPAAAPDATHTEVGHEGGAEHGGAFPPFDPTHFASQIFWLALTFGFFYWFLSKRILPRLGAILESRADRIQADLGEAERMRAETDAAVAAYEQALAEAKAKAGAIAAETRDKVKTDVDARRKAAETELSSRLSAAETEIAGIKARAMGEVDAIATDTAEAIVSALVGKGSREEAATAVATVRNG